MRIIIYNANNRIVYVSYIINESGEKVNVKIFCDVVQVVFLRFFVFQRVFYIVDLKSGF